MLCITRARVSPPLRVECLSVLVSTSTHVNENALQANSCRLYVVQELDGESKNLLLTLSVFTVYSSHALRFIRWYTRAYVYYMFTYMYVHIRSASLATSGECLFLLLLITKLSIASG